MLFWHIKKLFYLFEHVILQYTLYQIFYSFNTLFKYSF